MRFVFMDEENEALESNVLRIPKGLRYNDKSNLWKYLGALAGKTIDNDTIVDFDIEGVESIEDFETMPNFFTSGETPAEVKSIVVDGAEVIGSGNHVNLTLAYEIGAKSGREYNKILTIAPVGGKGKKRTSKKDANAAPEGAPV